MDRKLKAGAELLTGENFKPVKYEVPEENTAEEVGGVIVLPPIEDEHNPEIENYPKDYIDYSLKRLSRYKKENGKLPEWERDITEAADEINRLADEAQAELQKQADKAQELMERAGVWK